MQDGEARGGFEICTGPIKLARQPAAAVWSVEYIFAGCCALRRWYQDRVRRTEPAKRRRRFASPVAANATMAWGP